MDGTRSSGRHRGSFDGGDFSVGPAVGQELVEFVGGRGSEASQHVAQVSEGVDPVPLASGHETEENGGGVPAVVGAAEHPIVSTDGYTAKRILGDVVVDGQIAVRGVDTQRVPLIECLGEGLSHVAFGPHRPAT